MTKPNTATSLDDIAEAFELFASDQLAMVNRARTKRDRDERKIRADVWNDAAKMLRETELVKPE